MSITYFSEERCVMCGEIIEEGRQVCFRCDKLIYQSRPEPRESNTRPKRHSGIFARFLNPKKD